MNEEDYQDISLGSIIVNRHEVNSNNNPRISIVDTAILKDGPRVQKIVKHLVIVSEHTGEVHHHAVKIETYKKTAGRLALVDKRTITLEGLKSDESLEDDEIFKLSTFLASIQNIPAVGTHVIIPTSSSEVDHHVISQIVSTISTSDKADMLKEILFYIKEDPQIFQTFAEHLSDNSQTLREAAATLNIARFSNALEELKQLIASDTLESRFQKLLSKNEWMFGSEYSMLLDNRRWTRDELQDFMLRRTTDGYLELIEIKTPLNSKPLFINDSSHDALYPRSELSAVIGQVTHYLEKLDAARYTIEAEDQEYVNKICAKIVIGRDGDKKQVEALRRLNGHLHRIEILTFDQLVRIAQRVLDYQQHILYPSEDLS